MSRKIALTNGQHTIVDDEDYGWLSRYIWHLDESGYAVTYIGDPETGEIVQCFMHNMIMARVLAEQN
jgi:hypothetical protein